MSFNQIQRHELQVERIMNQNYLGPIVIGALGGSGTRVVTQILIDSGIFMGDNLNNSNDNLIFTLLFKRPKWYRKTNGDEIRKHLKVLEKYMIGEKCNLSDIFIFMKALFNGSDIKIENYNTMLYILKSLMNNNKVYKLWGWKEPNTHIFLRDLNQYFDNLKYIYVIRHGLDMAFSRNIQQLYNWGWVYGVRIPNNKKLVPQAQLEYWIRANKHTLNVGRQLLGKRFYLQKFEELCINPKNEIEKLLNFMNIEVNKEVFKFLISLPSPPSTVGRYKSRDLSIFTEEQLDEIIKFGYKI
jgi:hypothetical protein